MLLKGKKGLVFGVANNRSIAWAVAKMCHEQGAQLGFTYLNDALAKRVKPLAESIGSEFLVQCDVQNDEDIANVFKEVKDQWGEIDFIVHSVAYASSDDLKERFHRTSREGFKLAMDISAYSLIAVCREAKPLLKSGGSIITMTYHGAVSVVPNYRVMGVAKAALEASVRELAADFGVDGIRVNAVSAGPIKTLAASGIADFKGLLAAFEARAPLQRLTTVDDVASSSLYLLSDMSSAVTGEVHYVDCGFNVVTA